MVTNNTLLLFRRLYDHNLDLFYSFIGNLIEDSEKEELMINFGQQVKSDSSVPDGIIEQKSFKVIIETRLYGQQNINQIKDMAIVYWGDDLQRKDGRWVYSNFKKGSRRSLSNEVLNAYRVLLTRGRVGTIIVSQT